MSMQFLSATADDSGIHYSVWLDTTKKQEDGSIDQTYVRNYDWGSVPADFPGGATAYQSMTETEVKLLARADLQAMQPPATPAPTTLSVAGTTF